jgi:hypothetical protein
LRIILPIAGAAIGWWLVWRAVTDPETWPYLAAYFALSFIVMFCWGWLEERLGYEIAARPEDDAAESVACRLPGVEVPVRAPGPETELGQGFAGLQSRRDHIAADARAVSRCADESAAADRANRVSAELH